jgi:hypothetical protein
VCPLNGGPEQKLFGASWLTVRRGLELVTKDSQARATVDFGQFGGQQSTATDSVSPAMSQ